MNIAIVTQNLSFGGVQKTALALAHSLLTEAQVDIVAFEESCRSISLPKGVGYYVLQKMSLDMHRIYSLPEPEQEAIGKELFHFRVQALQAHFNRYVYDAIVVFEDYNALVTLSATSQPEKVIVSSRVSLNALYRGRLIHLCNEQFYFTSITQQYAKAAHVIAVSRGVADELMEHGIQSQVIYNGIDFPAIQKLATEDHCEDLFILHVGRIDFRQKGQLDALQAFEQIHAYVPHKLLFIGGGPDESLLRTKVLEYGLTGRVKILPFQENPYKYMSSSSLLIFTSYFEGLPNTLLEAISLGCPVVSYAFIPSHREIFSDCIVPPVDCGNVSALAETMQSVLIDSNLQKLLSEWSVRRSMEFRVENFYRQWKNLIHEVAVGG